MAGQDSSVEEKNVHVFIQMEHLNNSILIFYFSSSVQNDIK